MATCGRCRLQGDSLNAGFREDFVVVLYKSWIEIANEPVINRRSSPTSGDFRFDRTGVDQFSPVYTLQVKSRSEQIKYGEFPTPSTRIPFSKTNSKFVPSRNYLVHNWIRPTTKRRSRKHSKSTVISHCALIRCPVSISLPETPKKNRFFRNLSNANS